MLKHTSDNPFSGCLLYAAVTLPLTALLVAGGVWLQRLAVWTALWTDDASTVLCCLVPCLGAALPLSLIIYASPLRRGTFLHHLAQMTDYRGLGLLDVCVLTGALVATIASLFLLPTSSSVVYLPAALVVVAVAIRWGLRNLVAVVPFDERGAGPDLTAVGQLSRLTADDLRDYNLPPAMLHITLGAAGGPPGQLLVGPWRLDVWKVAAQPARDPAWQTVQITGTLTNIGSAPAVLAHLPDWRLRDVQGRGAVPRQMTTTSMVPELELGTTLAPEANACLNLTFEVWATEQVYDLAAYGRDLAPGEEIVVPF